MEAIKRDELFDDELCGLVKFTDTTVKPTQPVKAEKKKVNKDPPMKRKRSKSRLTSPWTQNMSQSRRGMMKRP